MNDKHATNIDAFIPEVWSKEIMYQLKRYSLFLNLVRRDYDGTIENQNDIVQVPLLLDAVINEGSPPLYDDEDIKEVIIDKHKYFAFRLDDIAKVQAQPDLIAGYAAQGGRGMARTIDREIAALICSDKITQNIGSADLNGYGDITDNVIKNAILRLDEANAPENDRYLVISPCQKKPILSLDKFIDASKIHDPDISRYNLFGMIYGILVYVSNNLEDIHESKTTDGYKSSMMFHRDAFALCSQSQPRIKAAYDLDNQVTSVIGDILYGAGILTPYYAVQIRTKLF